MGNVEYSCFYKKLISIIFSYRTLNLARCYSVDISSMKYFLKPEICKNVRELDLTSCYWLKSVCIRSCVLKLSNLEALYVADTSLNRGDLMKILQASDLVFIASTLFCGIIKIIFDFHC